MIWHLCTAVFLYLLSLACFAGEPVSCAMNFCKSPSAEVSAKISACKIELKANNCDTLMPGARDCDREAFCTFTLNQSHVLGCLMGVGSAPLHMLENVVSLPKKLFQLSLSRQEYENKYFNPLVYQACKGAEDKISKASPGEDLDCLQSAWHPACPRTLVRNCKERLLEDFPDIKKSYGSKYQNMKYDRVVADVEKRLKDAADLQPSLAKFFKDHPKDPLGALQELLTQELLKQKSKFVCMNAYDVAHMSCDVVVQAFIAISAKLILQLNQDIDIVEELEAVAPQPERRTSSATATAEDLNQNRNRAGAIYREADLKAAPNPEVIKLITEAEKSGISKEKIKEILQKAERECITP